MEAGLAKSTVAISSYRHISPGVEAIGLRTNGLRYDNVDEAQIPRIAEDFMIASRTNEWDRESALSVMDYFADPMIAAFGRLDQDSYPEGETHALPPPHTPGMELGESILRRRRVRVYTGDSVTFPELSTLIVHATGVTGAADVSLTDGESESFHFRATPSGGGLYPIELYVAAIKVDGLAKGIYRYSPRRNELVEHSPARAISPLLNSISTPDDQLNVAGAAALLLFGAMPWRSMRKYGPRGLRFVFHEAGAMAEHVHLTSTALGLGSTDCSSFYDDKANRVLGFDGQYRTLIHMILVGWPA